MFNSDVWPNFKEQMDKQAFQNLRKVQSVFCHMSEDEDALSELNRHRSDI